MEHHSNIVPWHFLRERQGAVIKWAPIDDDGNFLVDEFEKLLTKRTRIVAITHMSNVTGTLVPVKEVVRLAHAHGIPVLLDGSQAAVHLDVDVRDIGCDFYAFSGHKVYGPTGIGVLWARYELLEGMPPWQTGGGMISSVEYAQTEFLEPPHRFEAGTPDIAGAVGLGLALGFIEGIGREAIAEHEQVLTGYAVDKLSRIPDVQVVPGGQHRLSVISFNVDGVHPHDVGTVLDQHNVAVRVGHHCAQPLMDKLGIAGTVRASLGIYNDEADIDRLAKAVEACREMFVR
jgi:cysteine desulfurase/selenocysteine lyase